MFPTEPKKELEPLEKEQQSLTPQKRVPVESKDLVIPSYGDRKLIQQAFVFALFLHFLVISMSLPKRTGPPAAPTDTPTRIKVLTIRQPPPRVQRQNIQQRAARRVPIPDPTPDDPEPIVEPRPPPEYNPIPPDANVVFGIPDGPPAPKGKGPLLAGGNIKVPDRIKMVKPLYPAIARNAGIEATIVLNIVLDRTGNVAEVQILRGHPLLQDAAIKAVKQWKYHPAIMNGTPVAVIFPVTVEFTLN